MAVSVYFVRNILQLVHQKGKNCSHHTPENHDAWFVVFILISGCLTIISFLKNSVDLDQQNRNHTGFFNPIQAMNPLYTEFYKSIH